MFRRAQITVQITWVFAIIAGILVVLLAFKFLDSQTETSTTGILSLNYVENELKTVASTPNTFNTLKISQDKINFTCVDKETSGMLVEGTDSLRSTRYQAIYTFDEISGKFYVWTTDWEIPGASDRLLILASEDNLVVVPDIDTRASGFVSDLPDKVPKQLLSDGGLISPGYDHYRFVFFDSIPVEFIDRKAIDILYEASAVVIGDDNIEFFELNTAWDSLGTVKYEDKSLIFAATYSSTPEMYNCNLDKSLFKFALQAEINAVRFQNIVNNQSAQINNECLASLQNLQTQYSNLQAVGAANVLPQNLAASVDTRMSSFRTAKDSITSLQNDLARGRNCPTI